MNMPAQISSELKEAILAFNSLELDSFTEFVKNRKIVQKIVHQLLVIGKTVDLSIVHSVITQKKEDSGRLKSPKRLATHQRPSVILKSFLKELEMEISKPNPLRTRQLSRKYGVAKGTIYTAVKRDLRATMKSKMRTQALLAKQAFQR
jgi:hypothetical protein